MTPVKKTAKKAVETVTEEVVKVEEAAEKEVKKVEKAAAKEAKAVAEEVKKAPKKETVKKTAKKAAETVVKETEKATRKVTSAAKKATAPDTHVYVEFAGKQFSTAAIVEQATNVYKDTHKGAAVKTVEVYVNADEGAAYYVVNGEASPEFRIDL